MTRIVDSEPQTAVQLHTRGGVATFGETWTLQEQEAVVGAINRRLQSLGCSLAVENDTSPPAGVEIVTSGNYIETRRPRRSRWDRDSWDD